MINIHTIKDLFFYAQDAYRVKNKGRVREYNVNDPSSEVYRGSQSDRVVITKFKNHKTMIIAFCGVKPLKTWKDNYSVFNNNIIEIQNDLNESVSFLGASFIDPELIHCERKKVESKGYNAYYAEVSSYKVLVTGHGRGGALAAAYAFKKSNYIDKCVVFGAPPQGNTLYAQNFNKRLKNKFLRVNLRHDPIPDINIKRNVGYVHAGDNMTLDKNIITLLKPVIGLSNHSIECYSKAINKLF